MKAEWLGFHQAVWISSSLVSGRAREGLQKWMAGWGHGRVSLCSMPVRWPVPVRYLSVGSNSRTCPRMLQTSVSGPRRETALVAGTAWLTVQ